MKMYLLDNGYMSCDSGYVVAMKDKVSTDQPQMERKWSRLPVYCVLIDTGEKKYLYDLGMDRNINQMFKDMGSNHYKTFPYTCSTEQLLENQLKLCDTNIDEIDAIVLSHMHYDHIGNIPLFHDIDVYVNADEYHSALAQGEKSYYFSKYICRSDIHYTPVKERFNLCKNIDVLTFGSSHCAGLLGLLVHLTKGTFLFSSDIFYTKENYGPPVQQIGKPYDTLGTIKVAEQIYKLVEETNAKVMFPHDWTEFQKYKKAPAYYE